MSEDERDEAVDEEAVEESAEESTPEEEELPLSELRKRMEAHEEGEESPLSEIESERPPEADESELFEEVDVGEIDGEAVWDAVVEGEADAAELLDEGPEIDEEPAVEPGETADEHVVNKREYCQRCEYFSEPPHATCTNEGTEIVELVDSDHFRVRDCPKVAVDDEALSGFASDGQ